MNKQKEATKHWSVTSETTAITNRITGKKCCQWQSMPTTTLSILQSRWRHSLPIMAITLEQTGQLHNSQGIPLLRTTFSGWQVFIKSVVRDSKKRAKPWGNTMIRKPILLQYTNQAIWVCSMEVTSKPGGQPEGWTLNSMALSKSQRLCHLQHSS